MRVHEVMKNIVSSSMREDQINKGNYSLSNKEKNEL